MSKNDKKGTAMDSKGLKTVQSVLSAVNPAATIAVAASEISKHVALNAARSFEIARSAIGSVGEMGNRTFDCLKSVITEKDESADLSREAMMGYRQSMDAFAEAARNENDPELRRRAYDEIGKAREKLGNETIANRTHTLKKRALGIGAVVVTSMLLFVGSTTFIVLAGGVGQKNRPVRRTRDCRMGQPA